MKGFKSIISMMIIAILFAGVAVTSTGCDEGGIKLPFNQLKETFFNTAINWALLAISEELGGERAEDRIKWIQDTMEENLGGLLVTLNEWGIDWKAGVSKAYYLVYSQGAKLLEDKLDTAEYEGADPSLYMVLEPTDFAEWKNDVLVELE